MLKMFRPTENEDHRNWTGAEYTDSVDGADFLMLTGGVDVNPSIYGEARGSRTSPPNLARERKEQEAWDRAIELGKPIVGVCRGSQLVCARSGGKLIQHVTNHGGSHRMFTCEGDVLTTTSTHHQMQYPFDTPHVVIAWTSEKSSTYLNGNDEENKFDGVPCASKGSLYYEPEVVYYPGTNALGIQGHPEYGNATKEYREWCTGLLNDLLSDQIKDRFWKWLV